MMKTGHRLRRLLAVSTLWGTCLGGTVGGDARAAEAVSPPRNGDIVVDLMVVSEDGGDAGPSMGLPFSSSIASAQSAAIESAAATPSTPEKAEDNKFLSSETVIIGCTAGATAGALAVAVPAIATASTGVGAPIGATLVAGTAVLGCAVGAVSGLAAIGTAISLTLFNQVKSRLVDDPPQPTDSVGGAGR